MRDSLLHSLPLRVWQVYNYDPRARLRKAQVAELKLGDSCRNWRADSLNIDPLKSQLVPSLFVPQHFLTHVHSHPPLSNAVHSFTLQAKT